MNTSLEHLPKGKRRELEFLVQPIRDGLEFAVAWRTRFRRWQASLKQNIRHGMSLRLLELSRSLGPDLQVHYRRTYDLSDLLGIPGVSRVDWKKVDETGKCRAEWTAIDPFTGTSSTPVLSVRAHMIRLYTIASELGDNGRNAWSAVAANLHLACSLEDLFAYTDVAGWSFMCGDAAAYDRVASDLAVKHLTGVIIFTLVWQAYEAAVEGAGKSSSQAGKGLAGRELLIKSTGTRGMPCLKACLLDALEIAGQCGELPTGADIHRCLRNGLIAGLAAEFLRQFRNDLIHGDILMPEPADWGEHSNYDVDADPNVQKFVANTRLALMLIQLIMRDNSTFEPFESTWSPGVFLPKALTTLHCASPDDEEDLLPLEELAIEEEWEV